MKFIKRLNKKGIYQGKHWYSNRNPFFACGYGLPNCTCYAFGRFDELTGNAHLLPTGNAGDWFHHVNNLQVGQKPRLGAIVCWSGGGYGHVAVVEEILPNGDIVTSNSGYDRNYKNPENDCPLYFWTEVCKKADGYLSEWEKSMGYILQGFIYPPKSFATEIKQPKKSIAEVVREVLQEKWDNYPRRKMLLEQAGYDYEAIQAEINHFVGMPKDEKSILQAAKEVLAGEWDNYPRRKTLLEQAGYNYDIVQAEVERLMKG